MRIGFITSELAPYTPGGAGTAVAELARRLADEHQVTVVVVGVTLPPVDEPFTVVLVESADSMLARSEAAHRFLAAHPGEFDLVEFVDFDALAYDSLVDRPGAGLVDTTVGVRVHGPADLMFEAIGKVPPELVEIVARETEVFRMADMVLAASPSMRDLVVDRYGLAADRVLVAPPPVTDPPWAEPNPSPTPEVVVFGRLGEVKGSHDALRQLLPLLDEFADLTVRFVGGDGWSVEAGRPMSEWLRSMVPSSLENRVRFEGPIPRHLLGEALSTAWLVVIPSRFEGYCLAADEARRLGHPLVVRDIAGLRDRYSEATGAVVVGSDLAGGVRRLVHDPLFRRRLADSPPPPVGDPLEPYAVLPAPRHPRSQAGLATAAVKRLETAAPRRRGAKVARRLLKLLPEGVARTAIRLVPSKLKNRFRDLASWPEEVARRDEETRRRLLDRRIAAGEFPELAAPAVTVVIPCFDQGEFLEDAIRSVFGQTSSDFEIVVVDDGSTDASTIALIDSLSWPRLRVVRQSNQGLPAARNAGIKVARGEYVIPLDADDQLEPEFIQVMSQALDRNPAAGFAHCWARLFGDIDAYWVPRPFNRFQLLFENSVIGCVLLRRRAWEAVGGYDPTMRSGNEDWELWVRLTTADWDQVEVRRPLFRYRKHGISMSVETESRFEEGLDAVRLRHPDLYAPEAVARLRTSDYPCLSVLSDEPDHGEGLDLGVDVEYLPGEDPAELVAVARGRFVVIAGPDAIALKTALQALEDDPGLGAVECGRGLMWRRWALLDPDSGLSLPPGADTDRLAAARRTDWQIPAELVDSGIRVMRQTPDAIGCGAIP